MVNYTIVKTNISINISNKEVRAVRINRKSLASIMIDKDMSDNILAQKSGVSSCTVSAIKNGKSCSLETIKKLSHALGVDTEKLIEVKA